MIRKVILQTSEQCIYYIKDTNLEFYLIIPNNKEVSIVLGLFPEVDENIVKTLPFEIDKAIVIPVINSQILTKANHLDDVSFKYVDNVLSYLINTCYKILTHNRLVVKSKVLLNNHTAYCNFNQKFIEKYHSRVELYNLIEKNTPKEIPTTTNNIFEPISGTTVIPTFTPTEPPFKNNPQNNNEKKDEIEESIEPILYDEPVVSSEDKKDEKDPGFVSYVLLGVLVAVISLVFLYMIL